MSGVLTLTSQLTHAADVAGHQTALIHENGKTSFSELEELAQKYAAGLTALGLGRGDRIALWLPNSPEHYALTYAIWRIGAINVGVNTRFKSKEVEDIVGRSGAKLLAFDPGFKGIEFDNILAGVDSNSLKSLKRSYCSVKQIRE